MFDVYLNDKGDLMVVRKRLPIPLLDGGSGRWRKRKKAVTVSDEIARAVQKHAPFRVGPTTQNRGDAATLCGFPRWNVRKRTIPAIELRFDSCHRGWRYAILAR